MYLLLCCRKSREKCSICAREILSVFFVPNVNRNSTMINSLEYDNIIKDLDIIDVQTLNLNDNQTWLHSSVYSGKDDLDIQKWRNECQWKDQNTFEFKRNLEEIFTILDNNEYNLNKQKFDSRTYTRPKKRNLRPSLHSVVQNYGSNNNVQFMCGTKTITKHSRNFGEDRRQTINSGTITRCREAEGDSSEFDGGFQGIPHNGTYRLDSGDMSDDGLDMPFAGGDGSTSYIVSNPININFSEPAHNLHNTFNKIIGNSNNRNDSLTNMSPPSLVSSIAMDGSGAFNSLTFSRQGSIRKSFNENDDDELNRENNTVHNSIDSSMTTSILDEKDMNTSMLSQCQEESLIGSLPPSMSSSIDTSLINSTLGSAGQTSKNFMENSLINSGTFTSLLEPADEQLPNGKPKFQLRKSFLKPDPEDNFDKFLALNANCNTDDLRGLTGDLLKNAERRSKYDTFRKDSEKENVNSSFNKDDSFLMGDGMSESFSKEIGRESLNITYNKLPLPQQRTRTVNRPQMEMEPTIVLPNQILSPLHQNRPLENNSTFTRKLNGTYDATPKERETPKRNGTFRKLTPPSNRNITTVLINTDVDIDDVKDSEIIVIDSNKECYVSTEKLLDISGVEDVKETAQLEKQTWTPHRRKEVISMAGGSSDSLEQNSSGSCSPHHMAPLNMDDLEHLAYEQEQKLYQVVSTPISKPMPQEIGSANILFHQTALSPILNKQPSSEMVTSSSSSASNMSESPTEPIKQQRHQQQQHNSSSLSCLNRMGAGSPRRQLPVKREASAPEIQPNNVPIRMPFSQKLGLNRYQNTKGTQGGEFGSDTGIYTSRSAGGSPAKTLGSRQGSGTPLSREQGRQLAGSDNELRGRKSGLPASKLRQYSSHKELNRIPAGPTRWSAAGGAGLGALRPSSRLNLYSSNPVLCPAPLVRQASYTLVSKDGTSSVGRRDFTRPSAPGSAREAQLPSASSLAPGSAYGQPLRAKHNIGPMMSGPGRSSIAPRAEVNAQTFLRAPAAPKPTSAMPPPQSNLRPPSSVAQNPPAQRLPKPSGLPRPSSGIPKRPSIRPPSTYSIAPRSNDQTSDCY